MNGHETQVQHENNCQLRVKESLRIVKKRTAHSEGGF